MVGGQDDPSMPTRKRNREKFPIWTDEQKHVATEREKREKNLFFLWFCFISLSEREHNISFFVNIERKLRSGVVFLIS